MDHSPYFISDVPCKRYLFIGSVNTNPCLSLKNKKVEDYVAVQNVGEKNLTALVAKYGAVMVGLDISTMQMSFQNYKGGIIDECS